MRSGLWPCTHCTCVFRGLPGQCSNRTPRAHPDSAIHSNVLHLSAIFSHQRNGSTSKRRRNSWIKIAGSFELSVILGFFTCCFCVRTKALSALARNDVALRSGFHKTSRTAPCFGRRGVHRFDQSREAVDVNHFAATVLQF